MVEDEKHFNAAQYAEPHTAESVWETIITLWATVHTGLPNTLVFDDCLKCTDAFSRILRSP